MSHIFLVNLLTMRYSCHTKRCTDCCTMRYSCHTKTCTVCCTMCYSCHTKTFTDCCTMRYSYNTKTRTDCCTMCYSCHTKTCTDCGTMCAAATQRHVLTVAQCVAEIKDHKEQVQCMFAVIEKLPKSNYDLFERLTFHLAK